MSKFLRVLAIGLLIVIVLNLTLPVIGYALAVHQARNHGPSSGPNRNVGTAPHFFHDAGQSWIEESNTQALFEFNSVKAAVNRSDLQTLQTPASTVATQ